MGFIVRLKWNYTWKHSEQFSIHKDNTDTEYSEFSAALYQTSVDVLSGSFS